MKDFYNKELTRVNIFGNYEYTYGMVITNPFAYAINGEDAIINFYPVKINKTGNGIEVTNLNEVKDWTLDKHGFNIIRDENTEFSVCNASIETTYSSRGSIKVSMEYHEDPYITYNSNVSVDTGTFAGFVHTYLTKRSEGFVSSEFHPEGYNLNLGDHIEITNRLTAAAMAKDMSFKDTEPCYAVMTILFLRGYDLPIARIFYNNNQEEQDNCILICINNIADVFESMSWQASLDTSKASMRIDESVKIKKHTQEVKQQTSFDQTTEFNFLAPMYSYGNADQNKLKELNYGVEQIVFADDNLTVKEYVNLITKLHINDEVCTIEDSNVCNFDVFPIDGYTIGENTLSLLEGMKVQEDIEKTNYTRIEEAIIINDDGSVSHKKDINYQIDMEEKLLSTITATTTPCFAIDPTNFIQYHTRNYIDKSGITFRYVYDHRNNRYYYLDPCNVIEFTVEDGKIIIDKCTSKMKLSRCFIRNTNGVPIFFEMPKNVEIFH